MYVPWNLEKFPHVQFKLCTCIINNTAWKPMKVLDSAKVISSRQGNLDLHDQYRVFYYIIFVIPSLVNFLFSYSVRNIPYLKNARLSLQCNQSVCSFLSVNIFAWFRFRNLLKWFFSNANMADLSHLFKKICKQILVEARSIKVACVFGVWLKIEICFSASEGEFKFIYLRYSHRRCSVSLKCNTYKKSGEWMQS